MLNTRLSASLMEKGGNSDDDKPIQQTMLRNRVDTQKLVNDIIAWLTGPLQKHSMFDRDVKGGGDVIADLIYGCVFEAINQADKTRSSTMNFIDDADRVAEDKSTTDRFISFRLYTSKASNTFKIMSTIQHHVVESADHTTLRLHVVENYDEEEMKINPNSVPNPSDDKNVDRDNSHPDKDPKSYESDESGEGAGETPDEGNDPIEPDASDESDEGAEETPNGGNYDRDKIEPDADQAPNPNSGGKGRRGSNISNGSSEYEKNTPIKPASKYGKKTARTLRTKAGRNMSCTRCGKPCH